MLRAGIAVYGQEEPCSQPAAVMGHRSSINLCFSRMEINEIWNAVGSCSPSVVTQGSAGL